MAKIAIVTDSTSYIPNDLQKKYDIHVAPALVIWSGDEMRDGVDIQPTEFYTRLESAKEMPTTSQPSPAELKNIYSGLAAEGYEILSIHVSHKLSGTIASAEQAQSMVPEAKIEIVDSLSASMGLGWPVIAAARASEMGASLAECKAIAERARDHTGVLLTVDTLEFLHRGGRIGGAQKFIGTALNFKPVLEVRDGRVEPLERVRTRGKALARLLELLEENIAGRSPVYLAALHANAADVAKDLLDQAAARINPIESVLSDVSPAVGTHTGPGTVGLAFMAGFE
ncbi:MAG: DegV family protein [Anaerolineae bacterium]|nr:DegV family protein [Anaerolineae bacterium]